jgi:hypothetical protein
LPQPRRQQVHVDGPLTNISIAYRQSADRFIADKVFPIVPVPKQSDQYFVYDIGDWYRTDTARRASGTESAGSGWDITTATYFAEKWAIHKDIDDDIRANADSPIDMDRDSTEFITQDMMIRREIEWTSAFFATSTWTGSTTAGDITPGNLWDTVAGTPIDDIMEQKDSISEKTGFDPNTMVLGPEVYKELKEHPDILDRIKYTQTGIVTADILASLLDLDRVLIPKATRNTAAEGSADSFDFLYGKNALLCYVTPSPGLLTPTAGYTFSWTGLGGNNFGQAVTKFRMEQLKSDRVEIESAFDQKQVAANMGVFFSAVVS